MSDRIEPDDELDDDEYESMSIEDYYASTGAIYGCDCGCGGDFLEYLDNLEDDE